MIIIPVGYGKNIDLFTALRGDIGFGETDVLNDHGGVSGQYLVIESEEKPRMINHEELLEMGLMTGEIKTTMRKFHFKK